MVEETQGMKKGMGRSRAAGLLALGLLGAASVDAVAQDFTVTLPVDLNNMPTEINAVIVECTAICGNAFADGSADNQFAFVPTDTNAIPGVLSHPLVAGSGRQVRAINTGTGEFHQNVSVSFSASPNRTPNHVGEYSCWLVLRDVNGEEAIPNGLANAPGHFNPVGFGGGLDGEGPASGGQLSWSSVGSFNNPALDSVLAQGEQADCNG